MSRVSIDDIANMDYLYLIQSVSDKANIIRDTIKLAAEYQVMSNTLEIASKIVSPELSNAFSYSVEDVSNLENATESYKV